MSLSLLWRQYKRRQYKPVKAKKDDTVTHWMVLNFEYGPKHTFESPTDDGRPACELDVLKHGHYMYIRGYKLAKFNCVQCHNIKNLLSLP